MKSPIEFFLEKLNELSSIKISDAKKYVEIIKEVKHYEEQCFTNAYEDGMSRIFNELEIKSDKLWFHNYYTKTFKSE